MHSPSCSQLREVMVLPWLLILHCVAAVLISRTEQFGHSQEISWAEQMKELEQVSRIHGCPGPSSCVQLWFHNLWL